jgi:hypothetical protein
MAASPAKGGPGSIFVPASSTSCLLGAPLVLQSGETLYAKPGTVVIAPVSPYPDSKHGAVLATIHDVSNVTIRGLIFDGNIGQVGTSSNLIVVNSADHILFDRIAVRNARGISIMFTGGAKGIRYSGVTNSNFTNTGTYYMISGDNKADRKQAVAFCCGKQDSNGNWNNEHNFARSNIWGYNGFDNLSIGQQSWFTVSGNSFGGTHNGGNLYCSHNNHLIIEKNTLKGAAGNGIDCFINDDVTITGNESEMNGAAGIQADGTQCGLIANNKTLNNFQSVLPSWPADHPGTKASQHRGGITIGGGLSSDTQGTANITISKNISGDTQPRPTQAYGIMVVARASVNNLRVTPDNTLSGNTQGSYGQQISGPITNASGSSSCKLWTGDRSASTSE